MTTWTEPRRVPDETGSHIEPPLDETWTDEDKLRWHAGVAAFDTGLPVSILTGGYRVAGVVQKGYYTVRVGSGATGPFTFQEAWTFINGVARSAEEHQGPAEPPDHADNGVQTGGLGDAIRAYADLADAAGQPTNAAMLRAFATLADRLEHEADVGRRWAAQASLLELERDEARAQVQRVRRRLDSLAANYEVNAQVNAREPHWSDIAADLRRALAGSEGGL